MPKQEEMTVQEMQTLLFLFKNAQRDMNRAIIAWPTSILRDGIHEMWSGFWFVIPPHMITEVRG